MSIGRLRRRLALGPARIAGRRPSVTILRKLSQNARPYFVITAGDSAQAAGSSPGHDAPARAVSTRIAKLVGRYFGTRHVAALRPIRGSSVTEARRPDQTYILLSSVNNVHRVSFHPNLSVAEGETGPVSLAVLRMESRCQVTSTTRASSDGVCSNDQNTTCGCASEARHVRFGRPSRRRLGFA
jgi:hypothetical protein